MEAMMKKKRGQNVLVKGHSPFLFPYGGEVTVHRVGKGHSDSAGDAGVIINIAGCNYSHTNA